jgi:hypothetical protein
MRTLSMVGMKESNEPGCRVFFVPGSPGSTPEEAGEGCALSEGLALILGVWVSRKALANHVCQSNGGSSMRTWIVGRKKQRKRGFETSRIGKALASNANGVSDWHRRSANIYRVHHTYINLVITWSSTLVMTRECEEQNAGSCAKIRFQTAGDIWICRGAADGWSRDLHTSIARTSLWLRPSQMIYIV